MYSSSYNSALVFISLVVAMLASYTALDLTGRISTARGRAAHMWLAGGACAMGLGIWSMHFVGMLAFQLPIELGYDPFLTFVSLMLAIGPSAIALWLVSADTLPWRRLLAGAALLATGIVGMHYLGMEAMQMTPAIQYRPGLVALSVVIAFGASLAALWIAFRLRRSTHRVQLYRAGAAVLMGLAISGMHYTGMASADFPLGSVCGVILTGIDSEWLAVLVITITLSVLGIALLTSVLDMRLESRTARLAVSLAKANEALTYQAMHDSLTDLPNRALLQDRISQAIQAAHGSTAQFAVLFLDLDGFKAVNDAYGHVMGDKLLIQVAQRLRSVISEKDTVARLGGDEFVVLTAVMEPTDAATMAEAILDVLREPIYLADHVVHISTSVGIALYPDNGLTQETLLANADAALYHAKAWGRDNYCYFEASMNANVHERLQLLQELRGALTREEFHLHYQPKFDARTGGMTGVEALLRWQHPQRGLVAPDQFIPLAEKSGLIVQIGEWVLDEACRQLSEWHAMGHPSWTVAVNLSAIQFNHERLVDTVVQTLKRHNLEARFLTVEVTETVAMTDAAASMVIFKRLHDLGVQIAIDDFGTGYSSLLYLKQLPAHELKIDRGFVDHLQAKGEDNAIVSAIIALGRTLNLKIVAEGVETVAQQQVLKQLGCDSLQGYLLGRPLPPRDLLAAVSA